MNIICIKDKLKEGVEAIARIAGDHPTLAIIKNVLIETEGDHIRLVGTNLEVGMQYTVPGKVQEKGSITVPANVLHQLLSAISEDRVTLTAKGDMLEIETDTYSAKLQGSSAEEFPLIPKLEHKEHYIEIGGQLLKETLDKVLSASQFSELRPELNSVFLHFSMESLVFAATDSFRLAEKTINESEFESNLEDEFRILIPLKTAHETVRLLKKNTPVKIYKDENQLLITTQDFEFISRLIDGAFPDYQAILPKEFSAEVIVESAELTNALKLAGVFTSSTPEVILKNGEKELEIFSRDEKLGENNSRVPAKIKGDFKEINFNWRYLLDGIRACGSKEIVVAISDENRPARLVSRDDSSFFYIVVPMLKG